MNRATVTGDRIATTFIATDALADSVLELGARWPRSDMLVLLPQSNRNVDPNTGRPAISRRRLDVRPPC